MMEITKLDGTDERLYPLVGPLVMNPEVLKQNNNYPFRTSESYTWYIAREEKHVVGFVPLEQKKTATSSTTTTSKARRHPCWKPC